MTWDGQERRRINGEHKELLERLSAIDVNVAVVKTKLDNLHDTNIAVKDDLKSHQGLDLWIQGSILTILLVILTRMFVH